MWPKGTGTTKLESDYLTINFKADGVISNHLTTADCLGRLGGLQRVHNMMKHILIFPHVDPR